MAYVVVASEVEDYTQWRKMYDENRSARDSAGLQEMRVFQDVNDPNMVCAVLQGELSNLQAFIDSPELKDVMKKAGVKGQPQVMYYNDVT